MERPLHLTMYKCKAFNGLFISQFVIINNNPIAPSHYTCRSPLMGVSSSWTVHPGGRKAGISFPFKLQSNSQLEQEVKQGRTAEANCERPSSSPLSFPGRVYVKFDEILPDKFLCTCPLCA